MDIQEQNFAQQALKQAESVSSGVEKLASLVKSGVHQSAEIDRLLVALLVVSRRLLDYIAPLKSTGEIHGLPKSATEASDRPEPIIFRKDDPNIDFGRWWLEKTGRLHAGLFKVAAGLSVMETPTDKALTDMDIAEIQYLAGTIVQMLNSGGLVIKEIKMDDPDETEDTEEQDEQDFPTADSAEDIRKLFTLADRQTKSGKFDAVIKTYENILKLSEPDSQAQHLAHWGIGEIHLNRKEYNKAEFHLKKALKLDPVNPIYHYLLGCTYRYTDNVEGALRHLHKAVEIDPSKEQYWGELGWVVGFNKDISKGIEYLKKSLAINPANPDSLRDIAVLYAKQMKWSEAELCIEQALEHAPDNPVIQRIKADLEHFRKEYERLKRDGKKGE